MTKITIVTDRRGKLIAAIQGHELSQTTGEMQAEVSFEPSHKLHRIEADIDLAEIDDPRHLEKELTKLIPKRGKPTKRKGAGQKR